MVYPNLDGLTSALSVSSSRGSSSSSSSSSSSRSEDEDDDDGNLPLLDPATLSLYNEVSELKNNKK